MTSPALLVLSLALVCSTIGLTSEQAADYDSRPKSKMSMQHNDFNINSHWTSKMSNKYITYNENIDEVKPNNNVIGNDIQARNLDYHISTILTRNNRIRNFDPNTMDVKSRTKRDVDAKVKCESFKFEPKDKFITHPHPKNTGSTYYYNNTDCVTKINASSIDQVIQLTFVDMFRIEYHPDCIYDYLEIRDGYYGYADLLGRFCGQTFPRTLKSKGPNVWLKFHSDETIEYEGFKINVEFKNGPSHHIPEPCYKTFDGNKWGFIDTKEIDPLCLSNSIQALDVLWTIIVPVDMKIYLNFTTYVLAKPNECNENIIQVFETKDQELDTKLAEYCGSVANSVTTKERNGHIMYVRMYVAKDARKTTAFRATFNAYRTLEGEDKCGDDEFDCEDNTCIDIQLQCDNDAHCRLKADEDKSCNKKVESTINQPHILVILIIFSLILSGMSFVFIFKCIRKLYQDHKIIKEHIRQSCEDRLDRLDSLVGSRLTLDPKRLQRDSEPRASLERDNHNNEMVKKQRSFSKHKQSSIDSDYQETHLDLDEEIWRREVESMPIEEDIHIERNGRTRKSDLSRKEESMKRRKESEEMREKMEHKREIRDVSVGAPDTKESGCQTRESLFQTDPPPSSDGSGSNSRGFSTFGYSGATIVRPSPPATTNTSEITIELLKQVPPHQESKPLKKIPDRRPISTETTRSAPDVIIVSKPIR